MTECTMQGKNRDKYQDHYGKKGGESNGKNDRKRNG